MRMPLHRLWGGLQNSLSAESMAGMHDGYYGYPGAQVTETVGRKSYALNARQRVDLKKLLGKMRRDVSSEKASPVSVEDIARHIPNGLPQRARIVLSHLLKNARVRKLIIRPKCTIA